MKTHLVLIISLNILISYPAFGSGVVELVSKRWEINNVRRIIEIKILVKSSYKKNNIERGIEVNASFHVSRSVMLNKNMIERPHFCRSRCLQQGA